MLILKIECFDVNLPTNPQGGMLWKNFKIYADRIKYLGKIVLNVVIFNDSQSVPPWGLGGKLTQKNKYTEGALIPPPIFQMPKRNVPTQIEIETILKFFQ